MTVEPVIDAEIADLTNDEAAAITARIRAWVEFPADAVKRAYMGRVWLAMGYESWSKWCDCELGGFKLPAGKRKEVAAALAATGMSERSIADVLNISRNTVAKDVAHIEPPAAITGQDGKTYKGKTPTVTDAPKPRHGNSMVQLKQLDLTKLQLRAIADVLEFRFPGTFEKKCTPEIAQAAAAEMRASIVRINKILRVLEGHGTAPVVLPTEATNVGPAGG